MCAEKTLDEIRDIWKGYDTSNLSDKAQALHDRNFRLSIEKSMDIKIKMFGKGTKVVTGFRSAAPMLTQSYEDMAVLHPYFWDHGTTDQDRESLAGAKRANPMFSSPLSLHYGTDPLLGFHLATAYAPLSSNSPLYLRSPSRSNLQKVVESAQFEFRAWGQSFRKRAKRNLVLRFFSGDALAFCYTLHHMGTTGDNLANWYRRQYSLEPLVLDSQDYSQGDAPLTFNVIDTSNITDHLGALSVIMATSPLLDISTSATLRMESLVQQGKDYQALIDRLVCGHFATISILMGLFPVEYWSNATTLSNAEEELLYMAADLQELESLKDVKCITRLPGNAPHQNQLISGLTRLRWRPCCTAYTWKCFSTKMWAKCCQSWISFN